MNKKIKLYGSIAVMIVMVAVVMVTFTAMRSTEIEPQGEVTVNVEQRVNVKKNTPVANFKITGVEDMICVECDKYGVDAELALAIARLETGHFTSEAYTEYNNVGGLSRDEEPIQFKDLETGVEAFVRNLYHNYIAEGLDTVDEIAPKYCPVNQEQWAETVKALME